MLYVKCTVYSQEAYNCDIVQFHLQYTTACFSTVLPKDCTEKEALQQKQC